MRRHFFVWGSVVTALVCSSAILTYFAPALQQSTGNALERARPTLSFVPENIGYSLTTLSGDTVRFGIVAGSETTSLDLEKWNGTVRARVGIPYRVASVPRREGDTLVYSAASSVPLTWWQKSLAMFGSTAYANEPAVDVVVRPAEPTTVATTSAGTRFSVTESADGGVEFDTVFHEKPASNIISFPFETSGLDFYYQLPLYEDAPQGVASCSETACWNSDGTMVAFRPENVVGSYAVYYKGKSGDYSALGGPNYKTGKAFDIYRPKIYDAVGHETWGTLTVADGALTVTIPQAFLDTATYPVTVDPTFGYTSIGGTTMVRDFSFIIGSVFSLSEAGVATSISIYTKGSGHTQFGIYDASSPSNLMAYTGAITESSTASWHTGSISDTNLSAGSYHIVENCDNSSGGFTYYYDSVSGYTLTYKSQAYGTWPSTISSWSYTGSGKPSAYVTYSLADNTPPTVSLTAPVADEATSSAMTLAASASDDSGVSGVAFYVDGTKQGSTLTSAPYEASFDTTATSSGAHTAFAVAEDTAGNYATSTSVSFTVDNTPPTVSVTLPTANEATSSAMTLAASASDANTSIATVVFYVNGVREGSPVVSAPYETSFDTTATTSGSYTAVAVATDAVGNVATSTAVLFTISNAGSSPSAVTASSTDDGAVFSWTTAAAASSRVFFGALDSYGTSTSETNTAPRATSHSVTVTGLPSCTTYHYAVTGRNAVFDSATSTDATFTTAGCVGGASVLGSSAATVTVAAGGTVSEGGLTLTVPTSFTATSTSATFQVNRYDGSTYLGAAGTPSGYSSIGNNAFGLVAMTDATTTLSSFEQPLTVVITYAASEVSGIDTSSLTMYRYDSGVWTELSGCTTDTSARTVTCTTSHFSGFGLFGKTSSASSGSSHSVGNGAPLGTLFIPAPKSRPQIDYPDGTVVYLDEASTTPRVSVAASAEDSLVIPSSDRATSVSYRFSRSLTLGMTGADVRALQEYLNAHGAQVAASGPGSSGAETEYFGPLTFAALAQFQDLHASLILAPAGLSRGTGYFGPYSITYINRGE